MQRPRKTKVLGICKRCNRERIIIAKGHCTYCYKRYATPIITCKVCGKSAHHQGKGMCVLCYPKEGKNYETIKRHTIRKYHNISFELWKEVTKACVICGFDKIVDLHHLDREHSNNSRENFVGLCPNHHKMMHNQLYSGETEALIREKLKLCTQVNGNSLQYCNNQTVERIADGSLSWHNEILSDVGITQPIARPCLGYSPGFLQK